MGNLEKCLKERWNSCVWNLKKVFTNIEIIKPQNIIIIFLYICSYFIVTERKDYLSSKIWIKIAKKFYFNISS